jgi:hypothetical protein
MWPSFRAYRDDGKAILENDGIGAAIGVRIVPAGMLFGDDDGGRASDILSGDSIAMPAGAELAAVDVRFEKFGREYCLAVPLADRPPDNTDQPGYVPVLERIEAGVRQIGGETALLPVAVAKIGAELETVKQHVRGVPVLQADLRDAMVNPAHMALQIQNQVADILTVEEQAIWRAVRNAGGSQKLALPMLKREGRVNSAATLSRRVKEIDRKLREHNLPPCNASGPATRYQVTGGHKNDKGVEVPVEFSAVEQDWAKDPAERETTIKAFLAASPEEQQYFKETKPGIEDEAKTYRKGRQ